MGKYKYYTIRILALIGLLLTLSQIFFHFTGRELCFNQGCQIVEDFLDLSPVVINGAGALFFLIIILLSFLAKSKENLEAKWLFCIMIFSGLVCEGILISIQLYIAKTFCSYCIIIATIIFLIGLIFNFRVFLSGITLLVIEIFLFSHIKFPLGTNINLNEGTYGVKTCSNPSSVAYLIFSQNCPHCKKVLENLKGCVKCEIHFNPVSKIKKELLPGVVPVESYRPEINILALKIFGINSVPVLIHQTPNGYKIIKGDNQIIKHIKKNCFCSGRGKLIPEFSLDESVLDDPTQGVCSMSEECK